MANTNDLKLVENELKKTFAEKYMCTLLDIDSKQRKRLFEGLEPDLVAVDEDKSILYVGEITTSGFLGAKGTKFHHGTMKKIFETFSKFYLIKAEQSKILQRLAEYYAVKKVSEIVCYLITPEGIVALQALGYREKLFKQGIMNLAQLTLSETGHEIMRRVLSGASKEIRKSDEKRSNLK